ncbi:ADP-ribose pyrophosphatase [Bifidobacterium lemurum]|uniref:ADP-ribose pyrophosphatase n=2 Tax=Bifidobacterium lemurum TaxID=1603886 RepID=A0A261FQ62_9BIFI|nr:ADP-ribose pyrophosphatase [Bifidobacterium lemurum]
MGTMPVLNDEVPSEGDFDAGRRRGEFDSITPEDFIRGSGGAGRGNPPGWLGRDDIDRARRQLPIAYVEIVPARTDDLGRISQVGSLLCVSDDGNIERTLITGRVLFHETLREAIARNVAKDLGDIALPMLPANLQPFTVAEFFPTPGLSECYDPRQHAIALCYVVPIAGDCKPQDETLDVEWVDPRGGTMETFLAQMVNGHDRIVRQALAWAGI